MANRVMKDSGIEWIGEIPESWKVKKIKYILKNRCENNNPVKSKEILSLTAKQGVIPLADKEGGGNKPKEDYSAYRLAYPGDIVLNSMNILSGSVGLSKYFGCVSPVYYMFYPNKLTDDVRYYNYIFQTKVFQKSLFGLGNGILMKESENGNFNTIRMRIPIDKFGNLFIPVANFNEQKTIADYLDAKCAEIDSLKADITEQIEVLKQYKQSVITEAVTNGLDPDVPMKDSGIEWIGEIPENWIITKFKYILIERNERSHTGEEILLSMSQSKGVVPSAELSQRTMQAESLVGYKKVKINDMVFNKLNPVLARFGCSKYEGITSPDFAVYYSKDKADMRYTSHLLKTSKYVSKIAQLTSGVGDGFSRLYTPQLFSIDVAIPSLPEQKAIADYLEAKCTEIDQIIESKGQQLEALEEYKKSMIYEYVTGKKEVPQEV